MITGYSRRVDSLAGLLRESGCDAFLAWSPVTMAYLHGFSEGAGERFMALAVSSRGEVRLICPALSATQASRAGIADIRPWQDGEDPLAHYLRLAEDWSLRTGIVALDNEMPAHMVLAIQAALPTALYKPGYPLLTRLTRVKDEAELELMRRAARIADQAFPAALSAIRPSVAEIEVEQALASAMAKLGGKPSFCIVAAGANGAEPHHLSDETLIAEGDVIVLDFGCTVGGYQSDITRTVCRGRAPEEAQRVYDIVYQAQAGARQGIRPGRQAQEVDRIARSVIREAGYGEFFMHRLGHGIGMRGHEEPNLVEGSEHALEVGNCFSVEPGIYLPGRFGVRIENIVAVTDGGYESLNEEPSPTLIEV
jgi:Xaa-Pro aminopeptidase